MLVERRASRVANFVVILLVALQAANAYFFLAPQYFYVDDFLNFAIAREMGLTSAYLFRDIFGHFAPIHRLLDFVVSLATPPSWLLAIIVQLLFLSGSTLALYRLLSRLIGFSWWNVVLVVFYGFSVMIVVPLRWWASAIVVMPAQLCSILALYGFINYLVTRHKRYFALTVTSLVLGLLFYIKALLIPVYAFLLACVLYSTEGTLKDTLRKLRLDWRLWLTLGACCVAYSVFYLRNYADHIHVPKLQLWWQYYSLLWLNGFGPAALGLALPEVSIAQNEQATIILSQLALGLVILASVLKSRSAWKSWAFFGIAFMLNTMIVAISRLSIFGPSIALDHRYFGESAYIFAIALALAFSRREPQSPKNGYLDPHRARRASYRTTLLWCTVVVFGSAVYVATSQRSIGARRQAWGGQRSRRFVENFRQDCERVTHSLGRVSLFNSRVPDDNLPDMFFPYNRYSHFLPLLQKDLRFNDQLGTNHLVGERGHVLPAELNIIASWNGAHALSSSSFPKHHGACIAATADITSVELPLTPPVPRGDWFLRVEYQITTATRATFEVGSAAGYGQAFADFESTVLVPERAVLLGDLMRGVQPGALRITVEPGHQLCINSVLLGLPRIVGQQ